MLDNKALSDIAARFRLASMAGEDADYNGWDEAKINVMVRSWQDNYVLFHEVKRLQKELYGTEPRRSME